VGDILQIVLPVAARKQQSLLAIAEAYQAVASHLQPAAEGSDLCGFADAERDVKARQKPGPRRSAAARPSCP
jgi:hypothetical protein